ncbi:MAG: hypothetical protein RLZZ461_1751 [Planctomycetota bacterium]|jgi:hypothetical protein
MPLIYEYRESADSPARQCDRRAIEFLVSVGTAARHHEVRGPGLDGWTPLAEAMTLEWPEATPPGDWAAVVRRVMPSVPVVLSPIGSGSGVVVREDGFILTNRHVVEHGTATRLRFRSGEYPAVVVKVAEDRDLALLKTYGKPVELAGPIAFDTRPVGPGTAVLAVGHPGDYEETVTRGIVSAAREVRIDPYPPQTYLQLDAAINPGNSGGPVLDRDGEVVGLATWKRTDGESLGFAIPADRIVEFLNATLDQIDAGEIELPSPQDVAALPFDPTPMQSIDAAISGFPGEVTKLEPAENAPPHLHRWTLRTDKGAEIAVNFVEPHDSFPLGCLQVEFEAVPGAQPWVLQDHRVLQALLRHNDSTFAAKFLLRSNGHIVLATERRAIDLDPSEARDAIGEVISEAHRLVAELMNLRGINEAGPTLTELDSYRPNS